MSSSPAFSAGSRAAAGASSSPWIKKPLTIVYQQETNMGGSASSAHHSDILRRHLTVWDLIGIGVGGTVGSGIFVLSGQIASQMSGPLTSLSFFISGCAACCSGVCYAELSSRIPAAGSTYVYAYVCLGEVAAVLAAACLTLEYGIAGAAVSRSWGDKVIAWLYNLTPLAHWLELGPGGLVNLPAGIISIACTALLMAGVQESKRVTNFFTALKILIVVFMTFGGFLLFQRKNMRPLAPYGVQGVLRGATSSFFGYLGYDEVCCVAGEAIDPARTMPRAVFGTLLIVSLCYVISAIALTGMVPHQDISPTSSFPNAFSSRGWEWAAQLTAIGEVVCLPVVVLVSLMAQPRVALSMAQDGLLPSLFMRLDDNGNLYSGTLICGGLMTIVSIFVPFTYLNDLISAGILVAFSMTNSSLILLKCHTPAHASISLEGLLALYNAGCFASAMLWSHDLWFIPFQFSFWAVLTSAATIACLFYMSHHCPCSAHFGGSILSPQRQSQDSDHTQYFETPWVPYLPCMGMAVNWYLIAQLNATGILLLLFYLGAAVVWYAFGCASNSIGHRFNWSRLTSHRSFRQCQYRSMDSDVTFDVTPQTVVDDVVEDDSEPYDDHENAPLRTSILSLTRGQKTENEDLDDDDDSIDQNARLSNIHRSHSFSR